MVKLKCGNDEERTKRNLTIDDKRFECKVAESIQHVYKIRPEIPRCIISDLVSCY